MPRKTTTTTAVPETRDDFRCGLCRQRDIFHCEHDTPYRDQYLGTYNPEMTREYDVYSPRSKHEVGSSTNSGTARQTNSHAGVKLQPIKSDAGTRSSEQQHMKSNAGAKSQQKPTGAHADGKQQHGKTLDHLVGTDKNGTTTPKASEHNKKAKSCVIL